MDESSNLTYKGILSKKKKLYKVFMQKKVMFGLYIKFKKYIKVSLEILKKISN